MAKYDFDKLSTQQIIDMNPNELYSLADKDRNMFSRLVSRVVSTANKRIKRLREDEFGQYSPSLDLVEKRGRKFSVRGKGYNDLMHEFSMARDFLENKTSTLGGFKEVRRDIESSIESAEDMSDIDGEEYDVGFDSEYKSKKFWKAYREIRKSEIGKLITKKGQKSKLSSERVQKALYRTIVTGTRGWRRKRSDIVNDIINEMHDVYKKETRDSSSVVDMFDDIENL